MAYTEWVKNSFRELEKDFLSGSFKPQNESTINAHLYHHMLGMLQDKPDKDLLLITDWHTKVFEKRRFIDLAIVRVKKRGEKKEEEPLLLVEIKETGTGPPRAPKAKGVIGRIRNDIKKLVEVMNAAKCARAIMIFFYRTCTREFQHGIPEDLKRDLQKKFTDLQKEFGDSGKNILFLFGPR